MALHWPLVILFGCVLVVGGGDSANAQTVLVTPLDRAFLLLDENADGVIDSEEADDAPVLAANFERADKNADNVIDFMEFGTFQASASGGGAYAPAVPPGGVAEGVPPAPSGGAAGEPAPGLSAPPPSAATGEPAPGLSAPPPSAATGEPPPGLPGGTTEGTAPGLPAAPGGATGGSAPGVPGGTPGEAPGLPAGSPSASGGRATAR